MSGFSFQPFRRSLISALLLAAVLTSPSCSSTGNSAGTVGAVMTECRCGNPEHDVLGCTADCCRAGPDCHNALCVCSCVDQDAGGQARPGR